MGARSIEAGEPSECNAGLTSSKGMKGRMKVELCQPAMQLLRVEPKLLVSGPTSPRNRPLLVCVSQSIIGWQ